MFQVGDWVRWSLPPYFVREGKVLRAEGVSLEILFLGQEAPTVIPVREYAGGELQRIAEPLRASQIERDTHAGMMTPQRAAAILGVDLKRLRTMLREGRLRGRQVNHKWVEVDSTTVDALRS